MIPEFFKYNTLISIPLFGIVALLLVRKTPEYSLRTHTISKTIHFLNHPTQIIIFRLNFIVKALLDFCFALYVIRHFNIPFTSLTSMALISSAFLFGTLAYFVEGKHTISHNVITYTSGVLLMIGQISLAELIGDNIFSYITIVLVSAPIILAFAFLFAKKTNVFVQALCMSIWYIWLILLVFRYL